MGEQIKRAPSRAAASPRGFDRRRFWRIGSPSVAGLKASARLLDCGWLDRQAAEGRRAFSTTTYGKRLLAKKVSRDGAVRKARAANATTTKVAKCDVTPIFSEKSFHISGFIRMHFSLNETLCLSLTHKSDRFGATR